MMICSDKLPERVAPIAPETAAMVGAVCEQSAGRNPRTTGRCALAFMVGRNDTIKVEAWSIPFFKFHKPLSGVHHEHMS